MQMFFELQPSTSTDTFSAEFTIDHSVPAMRATISRLYSGSIRHLIECDASNRLLQANAAALDGASDELVRDMILFSLVSHFMAEQSDWQMMKAIYPSYIGTMTLTMPSSKPKDCTLVPFERLQAKLSDIGNPFAGTKVLPETLSLCLPRGSSVDIKRNSLLVKTPVCQIEFLINEPFLSMSHANPGDLTVAMPKLSNGKPQYDNVHVAIRVTVTFDAYRAQDWNLKKYQDWSKRVVDGARDWFRSG